MQTSNPIRPFEVLLAFHRPPKLTHGLPINWLEAEEVTQWLVEHRFDTANVRAPAAIVLSVNARDSGAAAQVAREMSDRFAARARIATGKPLDGGADKNLDWFMSQVQGSPGIQSG